MGFGLVILTAGVLFLLRNLGMMEFDSIWQFWPLILIVPGLSRLLVSDNPFQEVGGLLLTGFGTFILLANLRVIPREAWNWFWPIVLIVIGGAMLARHLDRRDGFDRGDGFDQGDGFDPQNDFGPRVGPDPQPFWGLGSDWDNDGTTQNFTEDQGETGDSHETRGDDASGKSRRRGRRSSSARRVRAEVIFSGTKRRIDSQEFEGGKLTAVFGGVELDLRDADTKLDEMVLHVDAIFGGIEIRIPETWEVDPQITSILGGYDDKTVAPQLNGDQPPPVLIVRGSAVFGGVNLKN